MYLNFENTLIKANFTSFEKSFIAELVAKHSSVLENKRNDSVMCRHKQETWQILTEEFNSYDPKMTKRTPKQLKKCWENLKTRAKKAGSNVGVSPVPQFNMDETCQVTLVDNQPQVADIIAMQLKPISDVIKPLDYDSNDDVTAATDMVTIGNVDTKTTCNPMSVVPSFEEDPTLNKANLNDCKLYTLQGLNKLCEPSAAAAIRPPSSLLPKTVSSTITLMTTTIPSATSAVTHTLPTTLKNPLLRQSLSSSSSGNQEKQLVEEEQKLKVQFLKRKLEMAEEEHQETIELIRAKRQYVELKKQRLLQDQKHITSNGVLSDDDLC